MMYSDELVLKQNMQPSYVQLDYLGRCCGIKPLVYKKKGIRYCVRCYRAFDINSGLQCENALWVRAGDGFVWSNLSVGAHVASRTFYECAHIHHMPIEQARRAAKQARATVVATMHRAPAEPLRKPIMRFKPDPEPQTEHERLCA